MSTSNLISVCADAGAPGTKIDECTSPSRGPVCLLGEVELTALQLLIRKHRR